MQKINDEDDDNNGNVDDVVEVETRMVKIDIKIKIVQFINSIGWLFFPPIILWIAFCNLFICVLVTEATTTSNECDEWWW